MKYITYLNILAKLIATVAIFVFVQEKEDYYIVPILNSLGFVVAGIWSLLIIKNTFGIGFEFHNKTSLKSYFKDGWHVFVASLSGNLYGQGNIIILGLFTSPAIVGYYSVAQKLATIPIQIFQVLAQSLFPYLIKLKQQGLPYFQALIKKIIIYTIFSSFSILLLISIFSDQIYILIGKDANPIGLYSFSFWLVIAFFTIFNVLFNPMILTLKQDGFMSFMYLWVGISFVVYATLLTYSYDYKGMLFSMLIVEISIFIFSIIAIRQGLKKSQELPNE